MRPGAEVGNSTSSPGLFTFSKGNTLGPRLTTVMRQEMKDPRTFKFAGKKSKYKHVLKRLTLFSLSSLSLILQQMLIETKNEFIPCVP